MNTIRREKEEEEEGGGVCGIIACEEWRRNDPLQKKTATQWPSDRGSGEKTLKGSGGRRKEPHE